MKNVELDLKKFSTPSEKPWADSDKWLKRKRDPIPGILSKMLVTKPIRLKV